MRDVSDRFIAALSEEHSIATRVALLRNGEETGQTFDVVGGVVVLDANAASRGRVDLTLADDGELGLVPNDPDDPLAPYGNELLVERGIRYPDGSEERVSLGVFRIRRSETVDVGSGLEIRVSGLDRSIVPIEARMEVVHVVASGTLLTTAIQNLIIGSFAGFDYRFASSDKTTSGRFGEEGGDRWAFAQQMATDLGMELFFDGDGVCVLRPTGFAAWIAGERLGSLVEGEGGLLVEAGRVWDREGTYNRVIVTGEAPADGLTPPVRGVATDDEPTSPTYYFGPYGKVPMFHSTPGVTTQAAALDAARALLDRQLGTTQVVNFGAVVNPALEPGDVVHIRRERTGIDEGHIVDSVTIPLAASEGMTGTTRAVTIPGGA